MLFSFSFLFLQFLIESTLKAEREVIEQRKVNSTAAHQLSNLQTILEARRSTVLDAENSAHKAAARLCLCSFPNPDQTSLAHCTICFKAPLFSHESMESTNPAHFVLIR